MDRRDTLTEQLAALAHELLDHVRTEEHIDWRPTRHGLGLPATAPLPRPETRRWTTSSPGLLDQLAERAGTRGTLDAAEVPAAEQGPGRSRPGSRPPTAAHWLETLIDLESAVAGARARWRVTAGRGMGTRVDTRTALRDLVGLCLDGSGLTVDEVGQVLAEARSWCTTARVALTFDVPMVDLPDVSCPDCGGGPLRVRRDASSDVWCSAIVVEDGGHMRRCGAVWPRATWMSILDAQEELAKTMAEQQSAEQDVEREAS
jgi:hypothetical protein